MDRKEAVAIAHTLSDPSKMPGKSYSLPTHACLTGSTLRKIEGSVCSKCYAHNRGNYRFGNVKNALEKRLKSIEHLGWVEAMITLIRGEEWFRWHDSGDLQSVEHFDKIMTIAGELPETNFWLPTKERGTVQKWAEAGKPWSRNLNIRWSMPMLDQRPSLEKLEAFHPLKRMNYSVVSTTTKKLPNHLAGFRLRQIKIADQFFVCKAYENSNQCGYCRACWEQSIPVIVYPYH